MAGAPKDLRPREAPKPEPKDSDVPSLVDQVRSAPITFLFIAVNICVYLLAESTGDTTDGPTLLRFGAMEPNHVWAGDYWRLFTCMFLHIGPLHIAANTFFGYRLCTAMERALGSGRFFTVYLLSGFAGGCSAAAGALIFGDGRQSAGASGALFGMLGAMFAIRRLQLGSFEAFGKDPWVRGTAIRIAIWIAIGLTVLPFDNSAHIGGLVAGALATAILVLRWRPGVYLYATAFAALFLVAVHPWSTPKGGDAERLSLYADGYMTGARPSGDGTPFPKDEAKGERFAEKGCSRGIGLSCIALSQQMERKGNTERARALEERGCDLDPDACKQLHIR